MAQLNWGGRTLFFPFSLERHAACSETHYWRPLTAETVPRWEEIQFKRGPAPGVEKRTGFTHSSLFRVQHSRQCRGRIHGFCFSSAAARTTPVFASSLGAWLDNPPYANGGTAKEQIQCYALPYGAIGFASHILTYFTAFMLSRGRNPILFWNRLSNKRFNIAVALVGFCITCAFTVLTMVRCRRTWAFILVAVWKLVLSVTLTSMTVHAARMIRPTPSQPNNQGTTSTATHDYPYAYQPGFNPFNPSPTPPPAYNANPYYAPPSYSAYSGYSPYPAPPSKAPDVSGETITDPSPDEHPGGDGQHRQRFHRIWYWTLFYFLGATIGFVGICNIVAHNVSASPTLRPLTGAFGGAVLLLVLGFSALFWCGVSSDTSNPKRVKERLGATALVATGGSLFVLTVLFAFYTDWALAALAGDLVGRPGGDNALFYWGDFAAKRLPMLSF